MIQSGSSTTGCRSILTRDIHDADPVNQFRGKKFGRANDDKKAFGN